jgi:hypothetical protein
MTFHEGIQNLVIAAKRALRQIKARARRMPWTSERIGLPAVGAVSA